MKEGKNPLQLQKYTIILTFQWIPFHHKQLYKTENWLLTLLNFYLMFFRKHGFYKMMIVIWRLMKSQMRIP